MSKEALLNRLNTITQAAVQEGHVLAVLGLGSAGVELDRMDEYSDLDVWIVVEDGYKESFVTLGWLSAVCPIAYKFKHSPSGYGLLFEDGIFSELDIFEAADLATLAFAGARTIWKAAGVPDSISVSQQAGAVRTEKPRAEILGEALGNIYIGLGRYYRGEKLNAMRFVQVYAVDQALRLIQLTEKEEAVTRDLFSVERRIEQRFPAIAPDLAKLTQGYDRTPESAQALLEFLDSRFVVDEAIKQAILGRLAEHEARHV